MEAAVNQGIAVDNDEYWFLFHILALYQGGKLKSISIARLLTILLIENNIFGVGLSIGCNICYKLKNKVCLTYV